MKTEYYIYCYLNTLKPGNYIYHTSIGEIKFNYEPFYIGKGKNNRYLDHIKFPNSDKNIIKQRLINKIINNTKQYPLIEFLKIGLLSSEALNLEIELIKIIGRRNLKLGSLVNLTDGGEGVSGFIFDDKLKRKWSELAKKRAKFGEQNHSSKKVYQYSLQGQFIQEWSCKEEIKRQLNFRPTTINACCKGRLKTAFNFQWRDIYTESLPPINKGKTKKDGYLTFKDKRYIK
jgi:hypothetical protein